MTQHVADGNNFKYKDRSLNAGVEYYSPNWTDVDGGDIYPGPQLHARPKTPTGARVVIVNDKLAESLFGDSDPLDKQFLIDGATVHRDRPLSLHRQPDGNADVGRRRRFAESDRAARDRPPPS